MPCAPCRGEIYADSIMFTKMSDIVSARLMFVKCQIPYSLVQLVQLEFIQL